MKTFAQVIVEVRKAAGLTQKAVADIRSGPPWSEPKGRTGVRPEIVPVAGRVALRTEPAPSSRAPRCSLRVL